MRRRSARCPSGRAAAERPAASLRQPPLPRVIALPAGQAAAAARRDAADAAHRDRGRLHRGGHRAQRGDSGRAEPHVLHQPGLPGGGARARLSGRVAQAGREPGARCASSCSGLEPAAARQDADRGHVPDGRRRHAAGARQGHAHRRRSRAFASTWWAPCRTTRSRACSSASKRWWAEGMASRARSSRAARLLHAAAARRRRHRRRGAPARSIASRPSTIPDRFVGQRAPTRARSSARRRSIDAAPRPTRSCAIRRVASCTTPGSRAGQLRFDANAEPAPRAGRGRAVADQGEEPSRAPVRHQGRAGLQGGRLRQRQGQPASWRSPRTRATRRSSCCCRTSSGGSRRRRGGAERRKRRGGEPPKPHRLERAGARRSDASGAPTRLRAVLSWRASMDRTATVERKTSETQIRVELNLDGTGQYHIETPLPFLTHMLEQLSRHGLFDLHDRRQRATSRSTATTPPRTSASRSARRSRTRSATSAASAATARPRCRWTRRW